MPSWGIGTTPDYGYGEGDKDKGYAVSRPFEIQCGSEPARECAGSVTYALTDAPHSRAGSLPQGQLLSGL
ncbi:hypothetical protein E1508_09610 [Pseudomonas moraviensis]|nr:hypothetical protein E1508_09610 [Pseudomonas moraviensis]